MPIPQTLEYLRLGFKEWSYIAPPRQVETGQTFKQRVCDTVRTVHSSAGAAEEAHYEVSASHGMVRRVGPISIKQYWQMESDQHGVM